MIKTVEEKSSEKLDGDGRNEKSRELDEERDLELPALDPCTLAAKEESDKEVAKQCSKTN